MVRTNLPFARWSEVFLDPTAAAAVIDWIVHHATVLQRVVCGRGARLVPLGMPMGIPCSRRRRIDLLFNFDAVVDVLGPHAECDVADITYGQFERAGGFAAGLEDESVFLLVGKSFLFEERESSVSGSWRENPRKGVQVRRACADT